MKFTFKTEKLWHAKFKFTQKQCCTLSAYWRHLKTRKCLFITALYITDTKKFLNDYLFFKQFGAVVNTAKTILLE